MTQGPKRSFRNEVAAVTLLAALSGGGVVARAEEAPTAQVKTDAPSEKLDPFSTLNIHVQPLALIFGIFGADIAGRVGPNAEVGVSFTWFEIQSADQILTARQIGVNATFFPFGRAVNGGYFWRPGFYYIPVTEEDRSGLTGTQTVSHFAAGILLGREWMWQSGFNVDLAAGVTYHRTPSTEAVQLAGTTFHESITPISALQPTLEWSLGWAF